MSKSKIDLIEEKVGNFKQYLEEQNAKGIGCVSISKVVGVHYSVVLSYMKKFGIKSNREEHNNKVKLQKELESRYGDLDSFVRSRRLLGQKIKTIAEELGINPYTLSLWSKEWNHEKKRMPPELDRLERQFGGKFKDFLEQEYLIKKRVIRDIGSELELNADSLVTYLRYFGLPIRKLQEAVEVREGIVQLEKLEETERQILYGSLMGDGCITCHVKDNVICGNAWFIEEHCEAQEEYLRWKAQYLTRFGKQQFYSIVKEDKTKALIFKTSHLEILTKLRSIFYIQNGQRGIKTINRVILDDLAELGLAIWYQDDGSYNRTNKSASMATQGFTYNEHLIMQKYFKERWNLDILIHKTHMSKREGGFNQTKSEYWHLYFPVSETQKFFDLIRPHMHSTMLYKIGQELVEPDYMI